MSSVSELVSNFPVAIDIDTNKRKLTEKGMFQKLPKGLMPKRFKANIKPTLVLDMDDTLIHTVPGCVKGADFEYLFRDDGFRSVFKRPVLDKFLKEMGKHYTLVVFTMAVEEYASPLLDILENGKRIFSQRLYRKSCATYNGYTKDLRRVENFNPKQTILIDDNTDNFQFQKRNGVECSAFCGNSEDNELSLLTEFLGFVRKQEDVQEFCHEWRDWVEV